MKAYVYQSVLYCEDCGETQSDRVRAAGHDMPSVDSDDYPQPVADGGGETDSPQHCDSCGEFLENPLTQEGMRYAQAAIDKDLADEEKDLEDSTAVSEWAPHYFNLDSDPTGRLKVKVESRDDDPWTATVSVIGAHVEHWADTAQTIGGSFWECDGSDFAYAMPQLYPGCFEEWKGEGYDLDLSECNDEPLEHFDGMSDVELDVELAKLTSYMGWADEDLQRVRAQIVARRNNEGKVA